MRPPIAPLYIKMISLLIEKLHRELNNRWRSSHCPRQMFGVYVNLIFQDFYQIRFYFLFDRIGPFSRSDGRCHELISVQFRSSATFEPFLWSRPSSEVSHAKTKSEARGGRGAAQLRVHPGPRSRRYTCAGESMPMCLFLQEVPKSNLAKEKAIHAFETILFNITLKSKLLSAYRRQVGI
jgi:hypothetical protein